jgi:hypothetical protein
MCDPLHCAEVWDYLRDTLLLVQSRHFLGDHEPLALLVCPTICRALSYLAAHMDQAASVFFHYYVAPKLKA